MNLPLAVNNSDVAYLIDNSTYDNPNEVIAEIEKGKKFRRVTKGYDFKKKLPAFYKAYKKQL
jgi:hypothetical protein